jgi:hypothetical protein
LAIGFDAVADHSAAAMRASRGQRVNGAFETVEEMPLALHRDFEAFIVIVSADFTLRHAEFLSFFLS